MWFQVVVILTGRQEFWEVVAFLDVAQDDNFSRDLWLDSKHPFHWNDVAIWVHSEGLSFLLKFSLLSGLNYLVN